MEQQEIQGRRVTRVWGAVALLDLLVNRERLETLDLKVKTGAASLVLEFIRKTTTDLLKI